MMAVSLTGALSVQAQQSQQKFANLGQCKLENGQVIQDSGSATYLRHIECGR